MKLRHIRNATVLTAALIYSTFHTTPAKAIVVSSCGWVGDFYWCCAVSGGSDANCAWIVACDDGYADGGVGCNYA